MLLIIVDWFYHFFHWKVPLAFTYFSTRMILASVTSLLFTIFLGPWFIKKLYELKIGQTIRSLEEVPLWQNFMAKKRILPQWGGF